MFYYVNPYVNTYFYYTYPYPYIPNNCTSCNNKMKNNYWILGNKDYQRNEVKPQDSNEVNLMTQNLTPGKFSISYPFIPKNQPIIGNVPVPITGTETAGEDREREETIDRLNNAISTKVGTLFKDQVLLPEKVDFSEVYGSFETTLNEKGIVSILFDVYTYVDKAAHGYTAYNSITFDANTGEIYTFEDLFSPKVNYIPQLNDIVDAYIKENNITLLTPFEGVSGEQQFYLTPDSLVIYYQVYRYTPYYYGLFKIEIPYSKITNLIGPTSPIRKLL